MCTLNHPNILRVFGVVSTRGWIVMELCEVEPYTSPLSQLNLYKQLCTRNHSTHLSHTL